MYAFHVCVQIWDTPEIFICSGLNLILCYYAMGDREKQKRTFQKLVSVDLKADDEDKYLANNDDKQYNLIVEVIKNDPLRQAERKK